MDGGEYTGKYTKILATGCESTAEGGWNIGTYGQKHMKQLAGGSECRDGRRWLYGRTDGRRWLYGRTGGCRWLYGRTDGRRGSWLKVNRFHH